MLSDEEKDNVFKISVPIITNEELEKIDYTIENDLDNIVHQISETVSRDRDIIILKKVIKKQSKEIEELKKPKYLLNAKTGEITTINNSEFISKDKIKAKIEDIESQINDIKDNLDYEYNETMVNEVWRLENKIDVLQSLLEKE